MRLPPSHMYTSNAFIFLFHQHPLSGSESDEEDGGSSSQRRPTHRLPLPSMTVLCSWYQEVSDREAHGTLNFFLVWDTQLHVAFYSLLRSARTG